ncbi:MAG TPA: bifunctional UDP-N-acetylglucosamine diphosphorylase/glucosamine-1-phosphate N-acetyltransferase GlmU [Terriglobia bacterium]|nr:bifunctional UDP-N-acetylglucosamine diphosphorylase/glucosamine-1-phosphate N-acetyltransferase GlmU [Terriglobia bacterium]
MSNLTLLIMAAGKGTRFKSSRPKVLHQLAGSPLVAHVLKVAQKLSPSSVGIVVGHEFEMVQAALADYPVHFIVQIPQLGTGHAVQLAKPFWESRPGSLMVLSGDVPLITAETLNKLVNHHDEGQASVTLLSTVLEDPTGYGRVVRNPIGEVERIVEQKDASPEEGKIREINTGIYCFQIPDLAVVVDRLSASNAQREYYLTDCVGLLRDQGRKVLAVICDNPTEVSGVNSRVELAQLERTLRERKNRQLMLDGVTLIDPTSTYISPEACVGPDTIIHPNVHIQGRTCIGKGCEIFPHARISQSVIEDDVVVLDSSVVANSHVHSGSQIGPFAHLRTEVEIGKDVKIGNFVELKKTSVGDGSRASHLSYLGDAQIGKDVNIGAGTITCNYDGVKKYPTIVEDRAFIGSDSQLVAPVIVHKGAYVAAGSTITQEVPEDSLAIARSQQVIKPEWVKKRKEQSEKG